MVEIKHVGQLVDTTKLLDRPAERDAFWNEHGYLFFPGAFEKELAEELRRKIVQEMKNQGAVPADAPSDNFAFKSRDDVSEAALLEKVEGDCRTFLQSGLKLFETIFGGDVFIHKGTTLRYTPPGDVEFAIQPHQDGSYIPHNFRTVWIALMDVPMELGGLTLADGAHKGGLRLHITDPAVLAYSTRAPFLHIPLKTLLEEHWLSTNYKTGDVLVFHPWMVHTALPNKSNRVRMSMDVRMQAETEPKSYMSVTRPNDYMKDPDRFISEMPLEQLKKNKPA